MVPIKYYLKALVPPMYVLVALAKCLAIVVVLAWLLVHDQWTLYFGLSVVSILSGPVAMRAKTLYSIDLLSKRGVSE